MYEWYQQIVPFGIWFSSRLNNELIVKVADFGLAKYTDELGHYKEKSEGQALPIRWMSIEAIQDGIFSTKSDVVSYVFCLFKTLFNFETNLTHSFNNQGVFE